MDRKAYDGLTKVYTGSMSKVYEREIRHFFEQARHLISNNRDEMNSSTMSNKIRGQQAKPYTQPYGILGVIKDTWAPGVDPVERQKFDSILERVLAELEPVALSEQLFCIGFFQLDVLSPTVKNTQTTIETMSAADTSVSGESKDPSNFNHFLFFFFNIFFPFRRFINPECTTEENRSSN